MNNNLINSLIASKIIDIAIKNCKLQELKNIDKYPNIFKSKDNKINTYIIDCNFINDSIFKPWKLNRPVDNKRVNNIINYLIDNKPEKIEGEIFCAEIEDRKKSCCYEIYDGNHRMTAIKKGFNKICPESKIIITIIKVKNDKELLEHFTRINKMVPLSEADLVGDVDAKSVLYKIANEYCNKYETLHTIKRNPNRPYFNRDEFVDNIYKVYTTCNIKEYNELIELLEKVNNIICNDFKELLNTNKKSKTVRGLTISKNMYTISSKCGCYIFLLKNLSIDLIDYYNNNFF